MNVSASIADSTRKPPFWCQGGFFVFFVEQGREIICGTGRLVVSFSFSSSHDRTVIPVAEKGTVPCQDYQ